MSETTPAEQAAQIIGEFANKLEDDLMKAISLNQAFYLACVYLDKAIPVYGMTNTERIRAAADEIVALRQQLANVKVWLSDTRTRIQPEDVTALQKIIGCTM